MEKSLDFFSLSNEVCLNPEVYINIKQFKKMCDTNILG